MAAPAPAGENEDTAERALRAVTTREAVCDEACAGRMSERRASAGGAAHDGGIRLFRPSESRRPTT